MSDAEWAKWSDNEIGKRCFVSQPFVSTLRKSLITIISEPAERTYTTKHGTVATMNTTNISKPVEVRPSSEAVLKPFSLPPGKSDMSGKTYQLYHFYRGL